jgi:hypothetical protein
MSPLKEELMPVLSGTLAALVLFQILLCLPGAATANPSILVPPNSTFNIPVQGMRGACGDLIVQGRLNTVSSNLEKLASIQVADSGSFIAGSANIYLSGSWSNAGRFESGNSTVVLDDACTSDPATISGDTVFHNLTLTSSQGKVFEFAPGAAVTVTGTLTLTGTPSNPVRLVSANGQTVVIVLAPGAQLITSHVVVDPSINILNNSPAPQPIPALSLVSTVLLGLLLLFSGFLRLRFFS